MSVAAAEGARDVPKVDPAQVTDEVWNHIFLDGPAPQSCSIPADLLQRCRREFNFWYPFDLRVCPRPPHGRPLFNTRLRLPMRACMEQGMQAHSCSAGTAATITCYSALGPVHRLLMHCSTQTQLFSCACCSSGCVQVSGKDLINNHLSFCLYTHTAVWEQQPHRWPRAFRCNGHIKVNGEKMSKSLGELFPIRPQTRMHLWSAVR